MAVEEGYAIGAKMGRDKEIKTLKRRAGCDTGMVMIDDDSHSEES